MFQSFFKLPFTVMLLTGSLTLNTALAESNGEGIPKQDWSFTRLFGTFDRAAQQRGLQVFREVCSACHAASKLSYRNLQELGFSADQVKAIAAQDQITDGPNDEGEFFERPGLPSDFFKAPFANEQASRANNNGAYPPDLSLIVKAREGGANYLYALLTGYDTPPAGVTVPEGRYYNRYFAGHQISMPPPFSAPGLVTYSDGTEASIEQMAKDVTVFLAWAAEPELEHRKRLGLQVIIFLSVLTIILYAAKRRVWARLK